MRLTSDLDSNGDSQFNQEVQNILRHGRVFEGSFNLQSLADHVSLARPFHDENNKEHFVIPGEDSVVYILYINSGPQTESEIICKFRSLGATCILCREDTLF
jgi:hypothetical protein